MNTTPDINPLTDAQRRQIQDEHRGKVIGPFQWRNFCCKCGVPTVVHVEWLAEKTDLTCDECRPDLQTGNSMSTAFAPVHRE